MYKETRKLILGLLSGEMDESELDKKIKPEPLNYYERHKKDDVVCHYTRMTSRKPS